MEEGDAISVRRDVLKALGARGAVVDELLAYNSCPLRVSELRGVRTLPLPDEPHVAAWQSYARDAESVGSWDALRERLVQLQFPIRKGVSQDEAYQGATRRGELAADRTDRDDLSLSRPQDLLLQIHPSSGGAVPLLTVPDREDFESLVQAFTARNEPAVVPPSMGACLVSGYNNWDRIRSHRERWEAEDPARRGNTAAWSEEFHRLREHKELYQDRFILLSRGPYSGVAAEQTGLAEQVWLERSFATRLEHECTHYLTLRVFGVLQHNLLEELVADFVGLVRAFGFYRRDLASRFLGLEAFPEYRESGRLGNYRGDPPLSSAAFAVLIQLAHAAMENLERLADDRSEMVRSNVDLGRFALALACLTLEELASEQGPRVVAERLQEIPQDWSEDHGPAA